MPATRSRDTIPQPLVMDTPLPTLSIISPTPRTFHFPLQHNLSADSPYSSRSNSPFEPDLRPLALSTSCITPPAQPTVSHTLAPPTTSIISPSSISSPSRRKSSSIDAERRPKKGDDDYIKRPENAFILFRRKCCEDRQAAQEEAAASSDGPAKKQRQADLSKTISQQWKSLPADERKYWENLAKEKKKEHEEQYPNYVYRPQRVRDNDGRLIRKKNKSARGEYEHDAPDPEQVSFVVTGIAPRQHHGRSASAPTPPTQYTSIQIPNVYNAPPSCPTSPSLLPMISRRAAHPGAPEEVMSDFDYVPTGAEGVLLPSPFGQAGFDGATLQSSEFLRNMFNIPDNQRLLPPLDLTHEPMSLLPAHQISPASSSGPSSPSSGPYTPTSSMLPHDFTLLNGELHYEPPSPTEEQLHLGLEVQLQHELDHYNPSAYTWGSASNLWPAGSEIIIGGDDFDLNAIPPIELGIPKFNEEIPSMAGCGDVSDIYASPEYVDHQHHYLDQSLVGFGEMVSAPQAY